jgi:hypothetical protein
VELLSQRAFARRIGVTQAAVWKAIRDGRIPVVIVGKDHQGRTRFKIDPVAAERAWSQNTDQSKASNAVTGDPGRRRDEDQPPAPMDLDSVRLGDQIPLIEEPRRRSSFRSPDNGNGNGDEPSASDFQTYAQHRARREAAMASKAELELKEKIGSLVETSTVEQAAFDAARRARDRLFAIPERVASVLAAISEPAEILKILETEIEAVCGDLSGGDAKRG